MSADHDLFGELVRLTRNVPHDDIPKALGRVRELLALHQPVFTAPTPERRETSSKTRIERGGKDRSGTSDSE